MRLVLNQVAKGLENPVDYFAGFDAGLNQGEMTVLLNTAEAADPGAYRGSHPVGSRVPVHHREDGLSYIEMRDIPPSEVVVLSNYARPEPGFIAPAI